MYDKDIRKSNIELNNENTGLIKDTNDEIHKNMYNDKNNFSNYPNTLSCLDIYNTKDSNPYIHNSTYHHISNSTSIDNVNKDNYNILTNYDINKDYNIPDPLSIYKPKSFYLNNKMKFNFSVNNTDRANGIVHSSSPSIPLIKSPSSSYKNSIEINGSSFNCSYKSNSNLKFSLTNPKTSNNSKINSKSISIKVENIVSKKPVIFVSTKIDQKSILKKRNLVASRKHREKKNNHYFKLSSYNKILKLIVNKAFQKGMFNSLNSGFILNNLLKRLDKRERIKDVSFSKYSYINGLDDNKNDLKALKLSINSKDYKKYRRDYDNTYKDDFNKLILSLESKNNIINKNNININNNLINRNNNANRKDLDSYCLNCNYCHSYRSSYHNSNINNNINNKDYDAINNNNNSNIIYIKNNLINNNESLNKYNFKCNNINRINENINNKNTDIVTSNTSNKKNINNENKNTTSNLKFNKTEFDKLTVYSKISENSYVNHISNPIFHNIEFYKYLKDSEYFNYILKMYSD